jgi:N-acetylmuramoyl-L-alanine amidase
MAKVYIGVGHGGKDPGAIGVNGVKESNLNLSVAKACYNALKRCGVEVKISRTKDVDSDLTKRIIEANAFNADLALDIHHNAGGGDGAEIYHTRFFGKGHTLAKNILGEMIKIGQNSRGTKVKKNQYGNDYFGFIRMTNMPSVLVECAFVDNKTDLQIVDTEAERVKMGEAIARGVCITLGIPYVVEKKASTKSIEDVAKEVISGVWGNGTDRKNRLEKAGYDYNKVQAKVNELLGKKTVPAKKSVTVIAKEVIAGKWGNGAERQKKLTEAGYNYAEVQKKVNQLLK